jgi:hypothetical protein
MAAGYSSLLLVSERMLPVIWRRQTYDGSQQEGRTTVGCESACARLPPTDGSNLSWADRLLNRTRT